MRIEIVLAAALWETWVFGFLRCSGRPPGVSLTNVVDAVGPGPDGAVTEGWIGDGALDGRADKGCDTWGLGVGGRGDRYMWLSGRSCPAEPQYTHDKHIENTKNKP